MLRAFSGSCLSLDPMETVSCFNLVKEPHLLGSGDDYFTEDGQPVRPQPCAHTLHKVFSGSMLDLNAACNEILSDEDIAASNGARLSASSAVPRGHHHQQQQQPQKVTPGATVSTILSQLTSETEKERAKSLRSKTVVLVIGGVSYVSSHIVTKALEAGYSVRITGSGVLTPQQQATLSSVGRDHEHRLSISEADMTNTNSLRDALRGCKYVIHCGCPVQGGNKDALEFHLNAVQALFNAIRQAGKSTVKRVVIHGAASSVFHVTDPSPPSGAFDESCWNNVATNDTDPIPYARIYFEKEAWRLKQMLGVELVVILPSITIGPSHTEEVSDAMKCIQHLATASSYFPYAPNLHWNFVDVRDVAEAHVRALECREVRDHRVIVSGGCFSFAEIGKIIRSEYPHLTPPTRTANTLMTLIIGATHSQVSMRFLWRTLGVRKCLDARKAETELGMKFTPMRETLRASIEQMISAGELPAAAGANGPHAASRGGVLVATAVAGIVLGTAVWIMRRRRGNGN